MTRILISVLLLALCTARAAPPTPIDLLLVGADDATLRPVLDRLNSARAETNAAWTLWAGDLAGKRIAVTRSEGDPLNAVAATTFALRRYTPKLVVVAGASRAHDPALRKGDRVISAAFCAFDGMVSPPTELGAGSDSLKWRKLPHPVMTAGEKETRLEVFPADERAAALATSLPATQGRVISGILGSAPQINREADRIAYLRSLWSTSTEDGESAHVAATAFLFSVPVVGLRVIEGEPAEVAQFALQFLEAWK